MVKGRPKPTPVSAAAEVIFDPLSSGARKPRGPGVPLTSKEWHNFMGSSLSDMYRAPVSEKSADTSDEEPGIDIMKLLKDVEIIGAPTFRGRKQIENRRVVELGGKAAIKCCDASSEEPEENRGGKTTWGFQEERQGQRQGSEDQSRGPGSSGPRKGASRTVYWMSSTFWRHQNQSHQAAGTHRNRGWGNRASTGGKGKQKGGGGGGRRKRR